MSANDDESRKEYIDAMYLVCKIVNGLLSK